jgi:hypothetical protein
MHSSIREDWLMRPGGSSAAREMKAMPLDELRYNASTFKQLKASGISLLVMIKSNSCVLHWR